MMTDFSLKLFLLSFAAVTLGSSIVEAKSGKGFGKNLIPQPHQEDELAVRSPDMLLTIVVHLPSVQERIDILTNVTLSLQKYEQQQRSHAGILGVSFAHEKTRDAERRLRKMEKYHLDRQQQGGRRTYPDLQPPFMPQELVDVALNANESPLVTDAQSLKQTRDWAASLMARLQPGVALDQFFMQELAYNISEKVEQLEAYTQRLEEVILAGLKGKLSHRALNITRFSPSWFQKVANSRLLDYDLQAVPKSVSELLDCKVNVVEGSREIIYRIYVPTEKLNSDVATMPEVTL